jgi:hypothetical protein
MEQIKYHGWVAEEAQWKRAFTVNVTGEPWKGDVPVTVIRHKAGKGHPSVYPQEHVLELLRELHRISPLNQEQQEYLRRCLLHLDPA